MEKRIYHGASGILKAPAFGAGRPYNDFGLGFYCAESASQAAAWAVRRGRNGFVSAYSLNTDGLRVVNLCSSQYNPLHWLSILMSFREFDASEPVVHRAQEYINKYYSVDHQGCDCIIGYRADNYCFMLAQSFLEGRVSYRALSRGLSASGSNRQFVLKSNRAFDRISYAGYSIAWAAEHYADVVSRELASIRALGRSQNEKGLFIDQMIREEIKPYDARLR